MYEREFAAYGHIVEQEADRYRDACPGLTRDDHYANGAIGLIYAIRRFDPSRGVKFETFARPHVSGEIRHGIRSWRTAKPWLQEWQREHAQAQAALGPNADDETVANALGCTVALLQRRRQQLSASAAPLPLEDLQQRDGDGHRYDTGGPADPGPAPEQIVVTRETTERIRAALETLPRRQRDVLRLWFDTPLTLREIGALMGLTESHAHTIKGRALRRLREILAAQGALDDYRNAEPL